MLLLGLQLAPRARPRYESGGGPGRAVAPEESRVSPGPALLGARETVLRFLCSRDSSWRLGLAR
eukprot:9035691-Alexandrium_andersonii.AAC.1